MSDRFWLPILVVVLLFDAWSHYGDGSTKNLDDMRMTLHDIRAHMQVMRDDVEAIADGTCHNEKVC